MPENRLAKEKSPYLLQHAKNPVDWFPWCDEAFEKAKLENKPIFLSIGYSTCHWCHVMERESFEDEDVAKLMNDTFVSIKVDREERPDIDGIYMNVCQMLTGNGGWPLTIIMTPDKKPFFAGTYFPKGNRFGRSGMLDIVPGIKEAWKSRKEEILHSAEQITISVNKNSSFEPGEKPGEELFERVYNDFEKRFDIEYGGFGGAPKFPSPHNLLFLLRYWKRSGEKNALYMVKKTLIEMRKGGIYDHIGFGFHRYSTDSQWLVPHFEKMLYDQAQLVVAYVEAYQATGEETYKETATEILEYVLRDMTSPEGGFYSAEDADSEGEEGKFYLWDVAELRVIWGEDADLLIKIFNCEKDGNWIDQAIGEAPGTNILNLKKTVDELAGEIGIPPTELKQKIESARIKLFSVRKKRVHPYKDDKILTDWNGLMISAFSLAGSVFNVTKFTEAAEKAAVFIFKYLKTNGGFLLHRYREGDAGLPAHIDDYAFVIAGLINLYEATFNISYIKNAFDLNEVLLQHYQDKTNGGFFFTSDYGETLLARQKEVYDGAIPSGNSMQLLNLLKLGRFSGNPVLEEKANEMIKTFSNIINRAPIGFTQFLSGLDFAFGPSKEIVVVYKDNIEDAKEILDYINTKFIPNKILILKEESNDSISKIAPFVKDQKTINGKVTVYICENYNCKMPVTEIKDLEKLLR